MVKKLGLQQDPDVAERERVLARQTAEQRAERLAKARARVELFSAGKAGGSAPRAGSPAAGAAAGGATKPRIELFNAGGRENDSKNARTAEEA
jgi:chemotaxis protein CheD